VLLSSADSAGRGLSSDEPTDSSGGAPDDDVADIDAAPIPAPIMCGAGVAKPRLDPGIGVPSSCSALYAMPPKGDIGTKGKSGAPRPGSAGVISAAPAGLNMAWFA